MMYLQPGNLAKHTLLFTLLYVLCSSTAHSMTRTPEQMMSIAMTKLNSAAYAKGQDTKRIALTTVAEDSQYAMYATGDDSGYVIVSRDDVFPAILGYGTEGQGELPCCMKALLTMANQVMEQRLREGETEAITGINGTHFEPVTPLLNTYWKQGDPYNLLCPEYQEGKRSSTGCVATGMAMVMRYYKYPASVEGASGYYTVKDANGNAGPRHDVTINSTYEWEHMLNNYTTTKGSERQQMAVAQLMYDCGVAVGMNYGSSSGSSTATASTRMHDIFGYHHVAFAQKDYMSDYEWRQLIYDQIMNGCPLMHGGTDSALNSGHAFVLDGIDENGLIHVNWGWGHTNHGYFDPLLLNPSNGSTKHYFDINLGFIYGLQPTADDPQPTAPLYQLVVGRGSGNYRYDEYDISVRNNRVILNTDGVYNASPMPFRGYLGIRYENMEDGPSYDVRLKNDKGAYYAVSSYDSHVGKSYGGYLADHDQTPNGTMQPGTYRVYFAAYNDDPDNLQVQSAIRQRYMGMVYWLLHVDADGTLTMSDRQVMESPNEEKLVRMPGDTLRQAIAGSTGFYIYKIKEVSNSLKSGTVSFCGTVSSEPLTSLPTKATAEFRGTEDGYTYTVTEIADSAFYGCTSLQTVADTPYLVRIGNSAFEGCTALKTFSEAQGVVALREFGSRAFSNCTSLLQLGDTKNVVKFGKQSDTDAQIAIGDEAFKDCASIQRLSNNHNVSSIGQGAFEGCTALGTHSSGAFFAEWKINVIPERAFNGCNHINEMTFTNAAAVGNEALNGLPETATITLPYAILSDATFEKSGLKENQVKAYLLFNADTGYQRIISCEKGLALNANDLTVSYVKQATPSDNGLQIVTAEVTDQTLPAGQAVIVHYNGSEQNKSYTLSIVATTPIADNLLQPAMEETVLTAGDTNITYYVYAPLDGTDVFMPISQTTTLPQGTGYLLVDSNPTAINAPATTDHGAGVIYNLQGVKVKHTTTPGIYIRDKKKIVVR